MRFIVANDNGRWSVRDTGISTRGGKSDNYTMGGWRVYDDGRAVTIGFLTEAEALRHQEQIAEIYERYGW